MAYFKSEQIKIFPCTYRGSEEILASPEANTTTKYYDPESHMLSEYNLTHLTGLAAGKKDYIISYESDTDAVGKYKLDCIIHGYHIRINNLEQQANMKLNICVVAYYTANGSKVEYLAPFNYEDSIYDEQRDKTPYIVDFLDDNDNISYCSAVFYSSTIHNDTVPRPNNSTIYSLDITGSNGKILPENLVDNIVSIHKIAGVNKLSGDTCIEEGKLVVNKNLDIQNNANKENTISGKTIITGELAVSGKCSLNQLVIENKKVSSPVPLYALGGIVAATISAANGAAVINSDGITTNAGITVEGGGADITGDTNIIGNAGITGNITASENITAREITCNKLNVSANGANISGDINISGDVNITGEATFNNGLISNGKLIVETGGAEVNGVLTLNTNLAAKKGITVAEGGITIEKGNLNAAASTITAGGLIAGTITADSLTTDGITSNGKLSIQKDGADITGNLVVTSGTFTVSKGGFKVEENKTTIGGALSVTEDVTIDSNKVLKTASIKSEGQLKLESAANKEIELTGNTAITGSLGCSAKFTARGGAAIENGLTVNNGKITVNTDNVTIDNVTIDNGNISTTGLITAGNMKTGNIETDNITAYGLTMNGNAIITGTAESKHLVIGDAIGGSVLEAKIEKVGEAYTKSLVIEAPTVVKASTTLEAPITFIPIDGVKAISSIWLDTNNKLNVGSTNFTVGNDGYTKINNRLSAGTTELKNLTVSGLKNSTTPDAAANQRITGKSVSLNAFKSSDNVAIASSLVLDSDGIKISGDSTIDGELTVTEKVTAPELVADRILPKTSEGAINLAGPVKIADKNIQQLIFDLACPIGSLYTTSITELPAEADGGDPIKILAVGPSVLFESVESFWKYISTETVVLASGEDSQEELQLTRWIRVATDEEATLPESSTEIEEPSELPETEEPTET